MKLIHLGLIAIFSSLILQCSNVPISSIPKLNAVDFSKTDVLQLSAVAKVPDAINDKKLKVQYRVIIENRKTGERKEVISNLESYLGDARTQAFVAAQAEKGYKVKAYHVPPNDVEKIYGLREEILHWRKTGDKAKGEAGFFVNGFCYNSGYDLEDLRGNLWISAEETNGYVHLLRNLDISPKALEASKSDQDKLHCEDNK